MHPCSTTGCSWLALLTTSLLLYTHRFTPWQGLHVRCSKYIIKSFITWHYVYFTGSPNISTFSLNISSRGPNTLKYLFQGNHFRWSKFFMHTDNTRSIHLLWQMFGVHISDVNCKSHSWAIYVAINQLTPCTSQLTKTYGSKRPASHVDLLLHILLKNDFCSSFRR